MQIEIGSVYEGIVSGTTKFGVFVKLDDNTNGMVHISEISSGFVSEISDVLSVGDKVKVKVIEISDNGKIALSIKQAGSDSLPKKVETSNEKIPPRVWKGQEKPEPSGLMSFEDMVAKFKAQSEDKMGDLKRSTDKRGGGSYRRSR